MTPASPRVGPPSTWFTEVVVDGCAYVFSPVREVVLALNTSATQVWDLCDGTHSREELIDLLAERHGVPREQVAHDVDAILGQLAAADLLALDDRRS